MKLAVIGSRTFADKDKLFSILDKNFNRIELIISGGAQGADTLAQEWAQFRGVPYLVYPARWHKMDGTYDRGAGFRRNIQIIKDCDRVLCFWDGISRGTEHSIKLADQQKKPCQIVKFVETPIPAKETEVIFPVESQPTVYTDGPDSYEEEHAKEYSSAMEFLEAQHTRPISSGRTPPMIPPPERTGSDLQAAIDEAIF